MLRQLADFVMSQKIPLGIAIAITMSGSIALGIGERERSINFLTIAGDITLQQERAVQDALLSNELMLSDLDAVKATLEAVQWIYRTDVSYQWPDELVVNIVPQKPIAYWNDTGYINHRGKVFESPMIQAGHLPQLVGPRDAEQEVMAHYQDLSRQLSKHGFFIERLTLSERGAIRYEDQHGIEVLLGNVDINQRLQRVLKVTGNLDKFRGVTRIDARYNNGVAVTTDDARAEVEIAITKPNAESNEI